MRLPPPSLSILLLAMLSSCTTTTVAGHADPIAVGKPFVLHPGGQGELAGAGTLRYDALVNDSRCRPGVQCIWAGDAEVAFTWTPPAGEPARFSLHTNTDPRTRALGGGRQLKLLELERGDAPGATLRVDAQP